MSRSSISKLMRAFARPAGPRRHRRRRTTRFEHLETRRLLAVADVYENDDTPTNASIISLNDTPQSHTIHDGGNDVDWVRFQLVDNSDVIVQATQADSFGMDVQLFSVNDTVNPIGTGDPQTGLLRAWALTPGDYYAKVSYFGQEVENYFLEVQSRNPVGVMERVDFLRLAGEGINAVQFTPDGRLAQLLWFGDQLTYRVQSHTGQVTEESIASSPTSGSFDPRHPAQANLLFGADAKPHVLMSDGGETVRHYRRDDAGWTLVDSVELPAGSFESIAHLAADIGSDDSLHFIATVGGFKTGRLVYGTNASGDWQVQQVADPAATETFGYFAADHRRYVSMAVDDNNAAHVTFTPEFLDNGTGGFARPFNQLAYATNASGSWTTEIVHQPTDDSGESGSGATIAIGPNGQPAIAQFFVDRVSTGSASFSRLLYHTRQAGGGWMTETVASAPDGYSAGDGPKFTGYAPLLKFDAEGLPHIAFSDHASQHFPTFGADEFAGQIRHAVKQNGVWTIDRVLPQSDPLRNQMVYPAMAITSNEIFFAGIRQFDFLSADLTVLRSEFYYVSASMPRTGLSVRADALNLTETEPTKLTITRHTTNFAAPLTVTLTNGDSSELNFATEVTIPAGQQAVTIDVASLEDNENDGLQTVSITAAATGFLTGRTIINVDDPPLGDLSGVQFNDLDADGTRDAGEPGLSGWTIYLDLNQNNQMEMGEPSVLTDADGNYAFTMLTPGNYRVASMPMAGWGRTTPASGFQSSAVLGGQVTANVNFGVLQNGFDSASGRLTIVAGAFDSIAVAANAGQVEVTRNSLLDSDFSGISASDVSSIVILGGAGDNTINLQAVTAADFPQLGATIVYESASGVDQLFGSELPDQLFVAGNDTIQTEEGDDRISVRDLEFAAIDGGNGADALLLDGAGMHLNLSALADGRLMGVEEIDITGNGANQLSLGPLDVIELSDESDTLTVRMDADDSLSIGDGWNLLAPTFVGGEFRHRVSQSGALLLLNTAAPWQNPLNPLDVNRDGSVSPIDALLVINALNAGQAGSLVHPETSGLLPQRLLDTNGDNELSPVDVLVVVNFLNSGGVSEGEAGASAVATNHSAAEAPSSPFDSLFAWAVDEVMRKDRLKESQAFGVAE
ncbi:MAG: hypothetical protein KDA47_06000 [Planctomycetales bacterium]|nr:hypothetical protein [Planctomycetales bacterium]